VVYYHQAEARIVAQMLLTQQALVQPIRPVNWPVKSWEKLIRAWPEPWTIWRCYTIRRGTRRERAALSPGAGDLSQGLLIPTLPIQLLSICAAGFLSFLPRPFSSGTWMGVVSVGCS